MPPKTRSSLSGTSKDKSPKSGNKKASVLTTKNVKKISNTPSVNQKTPVKPEAKVKPKRLLSKSSEGKENISSNTTPKISPKTKKLEKSISPKQTSSLSRSASSKRTPKSLSSYHSRRLSYNLRPSLCNSRTETTPDSKDTSSARSANSLEISRRRRSSLGNRSSKSVPIAASVLNTPFTKRTKRLFNPTEISKKSPSSDKSVSSKQKVLWGQELNEWVGNQWRVTIMNSLSNFDFNSPNLIRMYQNTLRDRLASCSVFDITVKITRCGCFSRVVDAVDYISIKVSYSIPKDWDGAKEKRSPGKKAPPSDVKLLYRAMLVSGDFLKGNPTISGQFPLVLHSGIKRIQMTVVDWLQDSFGGTVARHNLSNLAMVWGLALSSKTFLNEHKDTKKGIVDLQFLLENLSSDGWQHHRVHAPSEEFCKKVKDRSFVKMKMESQELSKITECIISEEASEGVTAKERDIFYCVLQNLVEDTVMLPKEAFRLIKMSTPCLTLVRTGMLKVSCRKHIAAYIKWILEMYQDDSCYQLVSPDDEEEDALEETDEE